MFVFGEYAESFSAVKTIQTAARITIGGNQIVSEPFKRQKEPKI